MEQDDLNPRKALSEAGVKVTVACRTLSAAHALTANYKSTTAIALDVVNEPENLYAAISQTDIVISLIPYVHHALIVSTAIKYKKPVVKTSYISPALRALEDQAKAAGITVLNEIGLDPGIDHLYAVKTKIEVKRSPMPCIYLYMLLNQTSKKANKRKTNMRISSSIITAIS